MHAKGTNMTTNTVQKLRREANSLLGLSVINILSSAMVLAFGSATLFPNLISHGYHQKHHAA